MRNASVHSFFRRRMFYVWRSHVKVLACVCITFKTKLFQYKPKMLNVHCFPTSTSSKTENLVFRKVNNDVWCQRVSMKLHCGIAWSFPCAWTSTRCSLLVHPTRTEATILDRLWNMDSNCTTNWSNSSTNYVIEVKNDKVWHPTTCCFFFLPEVVN